MTIGIGGAGSKLASLLENGDCTIINISDVELAKVEAREKVRAVVHSPRGQYKGARKTPDIGRHAFPSIDDDLMRRIQGSFVFSSTGGGTGNGLCSVILEKLALLPEVTQLDKSMFYFVLPYADREATEFVDNTVDFLEGPVSAAIDSGNTGNIFLASNRHKFGTRQAEAEYNDALIESLKVFLAIPDKAARMHILDGHIDHEDFGLYLSRPYFNHYTHFDLDPERPFAEQLQANLNPLLLPPAMPIEALFLLEVPNSAQTPVFYELVEHFATERLSPIYSVLHNVHIARPRVTVSILYSRKPLELVEDFTSISETHKRTRLRKSLDQHVTLQKLHVDVEDEVVKLADQSGTDGAELLDTLKRLGKL